MPRRRRLIDEIEPEIALGLLGEAHVAAREVLPFRGQARAGGRPRMGAKPCCERSILIHRCHGGPLPCDGTPTQHGVVSFDVPANVWRRASFR